MLNSSASWTKSYTDISNVWVIDALTSQHTESVGISNYYLLRVFSQTTFNPMHMLFDQISRFTYLDYMLITNNSTYFHKTQHLAHVFFTDILTQLSIFYLPLTSLLSSDYQDMHSTILLLTPELSEVYMDYVNLYVIAPSFSFNTTVVFDSYLSNWSSTSVAGILTFMFFALYIWGLVYVLTSIVILRWTNVLPSALLRFYYYMYSISREIRIQFEVVIQTMVFFLVYWATTLMTFDDHNEEVIEFVDGGFFYFFNLMVLYICFKYSVHYFAFLEASVTEGRSVGFIAKQVFKDALNTLSLFLRFYILLVRINVYDTLDDFLDSYYIFVGDFDEDEYLNEVFVSLYSSLLFLSENDYDTSYLWEDEHDFMNDLFYIYFVVWGKLFYFMFFMLEEAARLGLAFYVCYLIIFEVHSVNCSYNEDKFFDVKRS